MERIIKRKNNFLIVKMNWITLLILSSLTSLIKAEFDCHSAADCLCSTGVDGDYDLLCPRGLQPAKLIAKISPQKHAQIQCTDTNQWEVLRLLAGLNIGPVNNFKVLFCPLPESSFRELMKTVGIPTAQEIQLTTHANLSNTLKRKHLEGLKETVRLNLNANALTVLPEDIFHDTSNLTWLDLKNNNLNLTKTKNIFRYVPLLEVLELGGNNLSALEIGIFKNLTRLRLLNVWGNKLHNLSRALFSDVPNLENLDLSSNGLINLPPDIFTDLTKLKNINLALNNFTSFPQGLFLSNINLQKVQIHTNMRSLRTLPPGLLANLTKLQTLNLHNCDLQSVPEDLLAGSTSLINLTLQKNSLITLPRDFLKSNEQLESINLSNNKLKYLPDELFQSTSLLRLLNLDNNKLTNLTRNIFATLKNVEVLNLSFNLIEYISSQAFEKTVSLKTINLSNNNIQKFQSTYPGLTFGPPSILQSSIKLEALYLAHNNISQLHSDWLISMTNLVILDLSYNSLQNISFSELHSVTARKLTLDLTYNEINYIDLDLAEELAIDKLGDNWKDNQYNSSVRVVLKGNPLICDCNAYKLVKYFHNQLVEQVKAVIDLDHTDFFCADVNDLGQELVAKVDPRLLTCTVEPCTDKCTCEYRPDDKGLLVNCCDKGLEQLPEHMPNNETLKKVETITNHTELDLSHNRLEIFPSKLGPGYDRVTMINLSYNSIRKINVSAFPENIEEINLDYNNLTRLDDSSIKALKNAKSLTKLVLTNNPWRCDCPAIDFIDFVINNVEKLPHYKNITCKSGEPITSIKGSVCPNSAEYIGISSIVIGVLGLLIGAIATGYYRYQREIKVWLYAHRICLWFVTEEELDKEKQYDAFVSYSSLDENFVVDKLVPGLESGSTKYKLCLHYRDWIVGDFIPNQIARSVEESRRTIVVLSPNFLESVWGRMEFRAAHSQALSEGRARVIVVLYGDIGPTENLDPELKAYLSMNTYVKWGDPWFWSKLRYALPHPSEFTKGMPLMSQPRNKRQKRKNGTLINGGDPNLIIQSETTPPADSIIADPLKLIDSKPI